MVIDLQKASQGNTKGFCIHLTAYSWYLKNKPKLGVDVGAAASYEFCFHFTDPPTP